VTTGLPTTRLGWTDMHITRAGFGAWAIGGPGGVRSWGDQDDTESIAAIRYAIESGVNWIDTAAVYGLGHSEEVVAAALDGLPETDQPYVFTKAGLVWDPANRSATPQRAGAPASLRVEVEASLRRLRVERIDLYQMHWPADDGSAVEDYWQVFLDLKREGKIRAAGLSNHGICQLEAAEGIGHVDAVQPPFNLIHRGAADDVLLWAHKHETGAIVYSPMASGLLTGAFNAGRAASLDPGDWRSSHTDFTEPALSATLALAGALRPIAERHGVTPAAVAVAWTLSFPGVTGAIVGARRPQQVEGWLPAAALELKEDDLAGIAAAIHATGAGTGPASPPLCYSSSGEKVKGRLAADANRTAA
jgi:aryl-alcohol dehydrogenase-like predicted oxidoreductase